jgi:aflatoxin B1 aldehyde reductase
LPTRFRPEHPHSGRVNGLYNRPETLNALQSLYKVTNPQGIDIHGASLRWLAYHSPLGANDGIILGASKIEQIDQSAKELAKGKLPDNVVEEFEKLWAAAKDGAPTGYR